jgi:hypothetical protein
LYVESAPLPVSVVLVPVVPSLPTSDWMFVNPPEFVALPELALASDTATAPLVPL